MSRNSAPQRPPTPIPKFGRVSSIPAPVSAPQGRNPRPSMNGEVSQLRVLYAYSKKDLESAKKQLENKEAHIEQMITLYEKTTEKSKKKIQELETKRMEESRRYEEEIMSLRKKVTTLNMSRENEAGKYQLLQKEMHFWKQRSDVWAECVTNCSLYEKETKELKEQLETERRKFGELEKKQKGTEAELERLAEKVEKANNLVLKLTKEYASELNIDEMLQAQSAPTNAIPTCQICRFDFDESPARTPRILCCGHSVCEECAGHLAEEVSFYMCGQQYSNTTIKCPFDRKETFVMGSNVKNLPKNFSILECVADNKRN